MGADDYISKPFNARVLLARLKAVLGAVIMKVLIWMNLRQYLSFGNWTLDVYQREIVNHENVALH